MIDATGIEFSYEAGHPALAGVNLQIQPGEYVCILGGNGSGKSTLAKHLNALLIPDKGHVLINGLDTADTDALSAIRQAVGMVFQNPDDQLVASLVEDDVAFGPENIGVSNPELRKRVQNALQEVGLKGFEERETHTLSGGQKQRVAIAGSLAMQPDVLILDEASAMLDPRGQHDLMGVCNELHKAGMTLIMITHDMDEAAQAGRVIVLDRGKIVLDGTPQDVLVQENVLKSLNLDVPFACLLSRLLQSYGLEIPTCIRQKDLIDALASALCPASQAEIDRPVHECPTGQTGQTEENDKESDSAPLNEFDGELCTNPEGASNIITFKHVSFSYDPPSERTRAQRRKASEESLPEAAPVWALHDISFSVKQGEFFGIAGHTGSGKSTLIQHLNGILQPTEGQVFVLNHDLSNKHDIPQARNEVGLVFQYPEHQLFADTVYNDVAFGPRNLKLSDEEVDVRVREALQAMQLDFDEVNGKSPFALSGGQQRRVALAGVLAMRPNILVLDEPVVGLDPAGRRELLNIVSSLHSSGRTILMISHDMDELARYCNRILILNEGETFALGTPDEIFSGTYDLAEAGLELPAPQRIANALRARGVPLPDNTLFNSDTLAQALTNR